MLNLVGSAAVIGLFATAMGLLRKRPRPALGCAGAALAVAVVMAVA